jgi:3-oxoadipate enol-lactonase
MAHVEKLRIEGVRRSLRVWRVGTAIAWLSSQIPKFGLFITSDLYRLLTCNTGWRAACCDRSTPDRVIRLMPKIEVRGRAFYYEEVGLRGEPLVFLSGLGGDHRAFNRPQRHFAAKYRALAFDFRDAGQSERSGPGYTTADLADDVAGWLRAIESPPAHVVGHSLGGLVAQELAISHRELVKGLVLASTHSGADAWRKSVIESWVLLKQKLSGGEFATAVLPWLVGAPFFRQADQIEGLIQFAERNPWPQDAEAFARQATAAIEHGTKNRLGAIAVPTLVLSGELDLLCPPRVAAELAERIPGASLVVVPGVGHMPHVEDQMRFRLEIERFLERGDA